MMLEEEEDGEGRERIHCWRIGVFRDLAGATGGKFSARQVQPPYFTSPRH